MHAFTRCDTVSAFARHGKLGALKLMRSEHCQEMFRELGQSWEPSVDLSRSCNHSHANCTHHPRQQWPSTQPVTSFSAHGVGGSSLPSFHHARTDSSCIGCALASRLASGDAVSNNIRKSQVQSSVAGSETTMASSEWNGCGDLQLTRQ